MLVADDLTGASDAGVQFAKRGLRTMVWLDVATVPTADAADVDVVVVDMDSRALPADAAYARMHALLARLGPSTPSAIVKKMDSTLRGNPGPELRALLEALPDAFAIVAPAYPKNGRTANDGVLYVDGVPVDRTDFGRDLFTPVRDARIAAHMDVPAAAIGCELLRAGTGALDAFVDEQRARGIRVAVADAQADEDLIALAALASVRDDLLWVGSAGLIEMLDRRTPHAGAAAAPRPSVDAPLLLLVGSLSAMTQRQIDAFPARAGALTLRVDPLAFLELDDDVAARACEAFDEGRDVLVALDGEPARVEAALAWGARHGLDAGATSRRLRERAVTAVEPVVARGPGAVLLSGGDMARTFCERYGVRGLLLLAEAAPGIPVSRPCGGSLQTLLVTKAGGFGRPQTYGDIVAALRPQVTA